MSVLTVADAKTHLNIGQATYDGELVRMIEAAEAAIAERIGPLEAAARTQRVRPSRSRSLLVRLPAASLTSVTDASGTTLTVDDLHLDPDTGVVTWDSGSGCFTSRWYDVTYSHGHTAGDDLLMAVKELVRHMWDTQRGGAARPGSRGSDTLSNTLPGAAYTFPIRVTELLQPYLRLGH